MCSIPFPRYKYNNPVKNTNNRVWGRLTDAKVKITRVRAAISKNGVEFKGN